MGTVGPPRKNTIANVDPIAISTNPHKDTIANLLLLLHFLYAQLRTTKPRLMNPADANI